MRRCRADGLHFQPHGYDVLLEVMRPPLVRLWAAAVAEGKGEGEGEGQGLTLVHFSAQRKHFL